MLHLRKLVLGALSLAALGAGVLVLVGDSVECPDGYASARLEATFESNCPTDLVAPQGRLALAVGAPGSDVTASLRSAGLPKATSSIVTQPSDSDRCVAKAVRLSLDEAWSCDDVLFSDAEQTVRCTRAGGSVPPVLAVGPDASPADGGAGSATAADGGAGAEGACTIRFTPVKK